MAIKGIKFGLRVDTKEVIAKFAVMNPRLERNVKNALDTVAGLAQEHARSGHPKVHDKFQGKKAMPFRKMSGPMSGPFAGQPRYLTRTGVTRHATQKERAKRVFGGFRSGIFNAMAHSNELEFGSVKRKAYPFMRPAAYFVARPMQVILIRAVRKGLGGK